MGNRCQPTTFGQLCTRGGGYCCGVRGEEDRATFVWKMNAHRLGNGTENEKKVLDLSWGKDRKAYEQECYFAKRAKKNDIEPTQMSIHSRMVQLLAVGTRRKGMGGRGEHAAAAVRMCMCMVDLTTRTTAISTPTKRPFSFVSYNTSDT